MHQGPLPHTMTSTEIDTEAQVPGMNSIAGGPTIDRTSTGGGVTIALTSAPVAEEPRGDPAMVETFTPRVGAATLESKVGKTTQEGQCRSRHSVIKTIHESSRPSDSVPNHAAPVDTTSRLLISQPSVSDADCIQKDYEEARSRRAQASTEPACNAT